MTVVAVVRLGQLEGGGHEHLVGRLGPDGVLYHPASEDASGQGVGALLAPSRSMWGSSTGPAAGSLLGNESRSPEQRRWHHWIPALETLDYPENFGFQDYQGFQDSGDGNEHWIWIVEGKINI